MTLPKETISSFEQTYGALAEELRIFYRELINAGFDRDQAMTLMITVLSQPSRLADYKDRAERWDAIKIKPSEIQKKEEQTDQ